MRLITRHLLLFVLTITTLFAYESHNEPQPALRWKTNDMRVSTLAEWSKLNLNEPNVETAIENYHNTAPFTQTYEEFLASPNEYLQKRLNSLDVLISAIDQSPLADSLQLLKSKAQKKKAYLEALPNPLEKNALKNLTDFPLRKKDINIRQYFWFERLDPLHRFGPEVNIYLDEWEASDVPNYYLFLETVEYHPILSTLAPFEHYVTYFQEEERKDHLASFKNGQILIQDKPLNNASSRKPFIFVVSLEGNFYINEQKIHQIHHSSEFAGGTVLSAGEIQIKDGKLVKISNSSGHYGPKASDILPALKILNEKYGNLYGVELEIYHDFGIRAKYDAQEYYLYSGRCAAKETTNPWTPIHLALELKMPDIASQLIKKHGAKLSDPYYTNAWYIAAKNKDLRALRFLLHTGLDPLKKIGMTSGISHVAQTGDVELFNGFLKMLNDTQIKQIKDTDALLFGAAGGSLEIVQKLVSLGSELDMRDEYARNIMHFAVYGGASMIKWIENAGFGHLLQEPSYEGLPFQMAGMYGTPETIEYLVNKGFDLSLPDYYGNTLLHNATNFYNIQLVRWLKERPEYSNLLLIANAEGVTPFHLAASHYPTPLFKDILSRMSEVDFADHQGLTAYGHIAQGQHSQNAQANGILLLEHGASPIIADNSGIAPWQHITRQANIRALVHLLAHIQMDLNSIVKTIKKEANAGDIKVPLPIINDSLISN